jgi:hypothetical protein
MEQSVDLGGVLLQLVLSGSQRRRRLGLPLSRGAVAGGGRSHLNADTGPRAGRVAQVVVVPVDVVLVIWWAAPGANPDALSVTVPTYVTVTQSWSRSRVIHRLPVVPRGDPRRPSSIRAPSVPRW